MLIIEKKIINEKNFKHKIIVYGGDIYSSGKKEHDPPHFHLFINNLKEIKILIPTVDEWLDNKILKIDSGECNNRVLKEIIIWLDELNFYEVNITNLEFIRLVWNEMNINNDIATQMNKIFNYESNNSKKYINPSEDIKILNIEKYKNINFIVKGGKNYNNNLKDLKKPHFYVNINGYEFKLLIPNSKDWDNIKYLISGEDHDILKNNSEWNNDIIEYLSKYGKLKYIQDSWNDLNKNNHNVELL